MLLVAEALGVVEAMLALGRGVGDEAGNGRIAPLAAAPGAKSPLIENQDESLEVGVRAASRRKITQVHSTNR